MGEALVEVGGGAGVFAEAAVEAVFEQGGELGELGFDGQAGGFAFADLLGGFVFGAAEGADGVAQFLQAGLGEAVRGEGRGVGGGGGEDVGAGVRTVGTTVRTTGAKVRGIGAGVRTVGAGVRRVLTVVIGIGIGNWLGLLPPACRQRLTGLNYTKPK